MSPESINPSLLKQLNQSIQAFKENARKKYNLFYKPKEKYSFNPYSASISTTQEGTPFVVIC
jgi:hypothetical protein